MSDHQIDNSDVVPESNPPEPVANTSRKRPSPEPELSDGAKKHKASSDFRIRTYDKLSPQGQQQRNDFLRDIRVN